MTRRTRVLIADDDPASRALLERFLAKRSFDTITVDDGPGVLRAAQRSDVDVVVLDIEMPGLDGLEVLARLRRDTSVPIILLTCRVEEEHRLAGFAAGADDYVCKPYSLAELEARIRAVLKRGAPVVRRPPIVLRDLEIDPRASSVTRSGTPITLTPKEFELLAFLAERRGMTFSRAELLHHVWGSTTDWQDVATVTEHIRRLRTKLDVGRGTQSVIETVRGFGYRIAPSDAAELTP